MPPTEHGDLNSDLRTNKHKQVKLKHKHGSEQTRAMVLIKNAIDLFAILFIYKKLFLCTFVTVQ